MPAGAELKQRGPSAQILVAPFAPEIVWRYTLPQTGLLSYV